MNIIEIARLLKDFERYDKRANTYSTFSRLERFNNYLAQSKCVFDALQIILESNNIEIKETTNISIDEYGMKKLDSAIKHYFKIEKGITAASAY